LPARPSTAARAGLARTCALLILAVAGVAGLIATYERGQALDAQTISFWNKSTYASVLPDLIGTRQVTLWTDAERKTASMRQFDLQYAAAPSAVSSAATAAEVVRRLAAGHTVVVHSTHGKDHGQRVDELLAAARAEGLTPRLALHPNALAVVFP